MTVSLNSKFISNVLSSNETGNVEFYNISLNFEDDFPSGVIKLINSSFLCNKLKFRNQNFSNYFINAESSNITLRNSVFLKNNFSNFADKWRTTFILIYGKNSNFNCENISFIMNNMTINAMIFTGINHNISLKSIFVAKNNDFPVLFQNLSDSAIIFEQYLKVIGNVMS